MRLICGEALECLKRLDADSVDSLVTDPPAGISFMGKKWDGDHGGRNAWQAWMSDIMRECLRVMKPGAHGLVWAIPRTSHWTATALEDAGFEVRDVITHLFGSGFPKSMNISIAIDKQAGAMADRGRALVSAGKGDREDLQDNKGNWTEPNEHLGITPEAKQWQGFGTALKPASEHWILIRKPCSEKTVAANVLKHGCGGINIDISRIEHNGNISGAKIERGPKTKEILGKFKSQAGQVTRSPHADVGRFPANLVLSHSLHCTYEDRMDRHTGVMEVEAWHCVSDCPVRMLDEQSGSTKSTKSTKIKDVPNFKNAVYGKGMGGTVSDTNQYADSGGASRFFYCAKASKSERNAGCEELPDNAKPGTYAQDEWSRNNMGNTPDAKRAPVKNHHPTVKPQKLMQYLIKMITPPKGVVLDPFLGSGSTGVAAQACGFDFIGIEREAEYVAIAKARISFSIGT